MGIVEILYTESASVPIISNFTLQTYFSVDQGPAVVFEIAAMPEVEGFEKLLLFRANDEATAIAFVEMSQVLDLEIDPQAIEGYVIEDAFADLPIPPFGQTLFYRIAAVRTIINEFDELEEVLSQPSAIASVNLIDLQSPDAPDLTYDEATRTLSWLPTTYNGTYYLFKQNSRANWEMITQLAPPLTDEPMSYVLPDPLPLVDEDGDRIYHRFKVQVENASGRLNILDNELTV